MTCFAGKTKFSSGSSRGQCLTKLFFYIKPVLLEPVALLCGTILVAELFSHLNRMNDTNNKDEIEVERKKGMKTKMCTKGRRQIEKVKK